MQKACKTRAAVALAALLCGSAAAAPTASLNQGGPAASSTGVHVHAMTGLEMSVAVAAEDTRAPTLSADVFANLTQQLLAADTEHEAARRARRDGAGKNVYERTAGVGGWGGQCTCPDGQAFEVGDYNNGCRSLACDGGVVTQTCRAGGIARQNAGMKVTCAGAGAVSAAKATWFGGDGYAGIFPTLWASRGYSMFDSRFDMFTRGLAIVNSANMLATQAKFAPRLKASDVGVPVKQLDIEGAVCGLAENVIVPKTDEDFGDVSNLLAFITNDVVSKHLSFPESAADCGEWGEGDDAKAIIQDQLLGAWPSWRVLEPWTGDVAADSVIEELVFSGFAQHRLQKVRPADPHGKTDSAYYAVYLDFAEALETRPGFAKLGATAYFSREGKVVKIVRLGRVYYPGGRNGTPLGTVKKCERKWVWNWFKSGFRTTCTPAVVGWEHAKLAFRGTLNAVITAIDHLYGVHLTVANAIVTANVEELPPSHPVRRLMTPFGFRTEAINYQASFALVNERGIFHRATPLTTNGMKALFAYARGESSGMTWATIPQRKAAKGIDADRTLPLDEDGLDFYAHVKTFVQGYLQQYYAFEAGAAGPDKCTADADIQKWHARVNSISPNRDLPADVTCANLVDILSTFIYYVSAGHNHVGTIGAEIEDPCFMPWAWREGELCGTPRTGYTQSITMAFTSMEQPKITEDYTHLFLDAESKQRWLDFSASLRNFDGVVAERNKHRTRKFRVFEVDRIETAVGI